MMPFRAPINPFLPYDYRYITPDGRPPNRGVPPGRPRGPLHPHWSMPPLNQGVCSHSGPPPPYSYMGAPGPPLVKCFGPCMGSTHGPSPPHCPPLPPFGMNPAPFGPPPKDPPGAKKDPPGARLNGTGVRFPDGAGYLFPELNVLIHLVEKGVKPWMTPGRQFTFKSFWAPVRLTVNELIRQVGARAGARAEDIDYKFGIIEIFERGDGTWGQGSKFRLGELECKETLEQKGWSEKRGNGQKPVWLVIFKD